jgi:hypothetical protein
MCWDPLPGDQVFDSSRASGIVDKLALALKEKRASGELKARYGKDLQKKAMVLACLDEIEKSAGFRTNVGSRIVSSVGKAAKSVGESLKGVGNSLSTAPQRTGAAITDTIRNPAQALKSGWHSTWHDPKTSGGRFGKGMFLLGTGMSGATAIPKNDPTGRGESRSTRLMRFGASTAGGIAGMKHGIIPSMVLGIGGDVMAGKAGRAIDRTRGYKPAQKPVTDPNMPTKPAVIQRTLPAQD